MGCDSATQQCDAPLMKVNDNRGRAINTKFQILKFKKINTLQTDG
jgi:hypothetical protein